MSCLKWISSLNEGSIRGGRISHHKPCERQLHVSSISARQSYVVSVHGLISFQHCSHTPAHCCHPWDCMAQVALKRAHARLERCMNVAHRRRLVAQEFVAGNPRVEFFAGTPPLFAAVLLVSMAAGTTGIGCLLYVLIAQGVNVGDTPSCRRPTGSVSR